MAGNPTGLVYNSELIEWESEKDSEGEYIIKITVSDDYGGSCYSQLILSVIKNEPPICPILPK